MKLRLLLTGSLLLQFAVYSLGETDTNTINTWNQQSLGMAYSKPSEALKLAEKTVREARKIGFHRGEVRALIRMGIVYDVQSRFDKSIAVYEESLQISRKTHDDKAVASNLNNLGLIYWKLGELNNGLNYLYEAYEMFGRIGDELNMASAANNIGLIHEEQFRAKKSLAWHRKAIDHYHRADEEYLIYDAYSNIGNSFESLGKSDSAQFYQRKAIAGYRKTGNRYGLGISLNNLGISLTTSRKAEEAVPYLQESMAVAQELGNQASYISAGYNLSSAYKELGDYTRQQRLLEEIYPAISGLRSNELGYKICYDLGESYYRSGNLQLGKQRMNEYRAYHFAYYKEMLNSNLVEAEKKFDLRAEQQRSRLFRERAAFRMKREAAGRFTDNLIWTSGLIVVLLAGLLVFFVIRKRSLQQQLISQKAVFDATSEERRRISYDLHDHVGSQFSYVVNNLELISHQEPDSERIQRTFAMSQAAMSSLRDTVWALHSEELTLQSLAERMENVARKTLESSDTLQLHFESAALQAIVIPQQTTMHVMRIFQEAVHNAARHSKATLLSINVWETSDHLHVRIADNGIGIAENPHKPFHYGIQSMKERAAKIGGKLEIANGEKDGTVVSLSWPKNNPNA